MAGSCFKSVRSFLRLGDDPGRREDSQNDDDPPPPVSLAFTCVHCQLKNHGPDVMATKRKAILGKLQLQRAAYNAIHPWDRCSFISANAALFCEKFMRQNSFDLAVQVVEKVGVARDNCWHKPGNNS